MVPQYSDVGITSNPDARTPFGASTFTVPANDADPNARNITYNATGRKPKVSARSKNPYSVAGNT